MWEHIVKLDILVLSFLMTNELCKIFIPKGQSLGAIDGHKVLVQITKYADGHDNPEGQVSAILHKMIQALISCLLFINMA